MKNQTQQPLIDKAALQEALGLSGYQENPVTTEITIPDKQTTLTVSTIPGTDTKQAADKHFSFEEYRQTFLKVPRLTDRKPVFVSASTRERLDRIVRQLGDRKMSVSGLIENLALHHLKTYGEGIDQWRKQ